MQATTTRKIAAASLLSTLIATPVVALTCNIGGETKLACRAGDKAYGKYTMNSCSGANCGAYVQCIAGELGTNLDWVNGPRSGSFDCSISNSNPLRIVYRLTCYYNDSTVFVDPSRLHPTFIKPRSLETCLQLVNEIGLGPMAMGAFLEGGLPMDKAVLTSHSNFQLTKCLYALRAMDGYCVAGPRPPTQADGGFTPRTAASSASPANAQPAADYTQLTQPAVRVLAGAPVPASLQALHLLGLTLARRAAYEEALAATAALAAAAHEASDAGSAQLQVNWGKTLTTQIAAMLRAEIALRKQAAIELKAGADFTITVGQVQQYQQMLSTSGLPARLVTQLQSLGATNADLTALKERILAWNPALVAGLVSDSIANASVLASLETAANQIVLTFD